MRIFVWLSCLVLLFSLFPAAAVADDAGVLSVTELNDWISQVLLDSANREPLNAPVGEESHTEDGYAFLYSFATLYYDKPVLDENSVLTGFSVTDEHYPTPRGIRLGSDARALLDTYGWQNPALAGDGVFAAFYLLEELPQTAYWSWAQLDEAGEMQKVQCAVHAFNGHGMYTDAGVEYSLDGDSVTAIRVYGLNRLITEEEMNSNLDAVFFAQGEGMNHED